VKPRVIFADPEALVIDYLKAQFLARVEAYKPAVIGTGFPSEPLVAQYRLQVELEVGNADDYPVTERAQVRVACHGPRSFASPSTRQARTEIKALASLTQSLMYSHPGDVNVAGAVILGGRSDVITDPDTTNLMVWFLARVDLKATLLAS